MGKMKEVFMKMREEEWVGDPKEYLKHYVNEYIKDKDIYMDIPCPNCFNKKLLFNSTTDIKCKHQGCGQKFILVDSNTVRYA